jgi:hypothetical protein
MVTPLDTVAAGTVAAELLMDSVTPLGESTQPFLKQQPPPSYQESDFTHGSSSSSSSSASASLNSIIPYIPTALSALCIAILAKNVNDTLKSLPVTSDDVPSSTFDKEQVELDLTEQYGNGNNNSNNSNDSTLNVFADLDQSSEENIEASLPVFDQQSHSNVLDIHPAIVTTLFKEDKKEQEVEQLASEVKDSEVSAADIEAAAPKYRFKWGDNSPSTLSPTLQMARIMDYEARQRAEKAMGITLATLKVALELLAKASASEEEVLHKVCRLPAQP